MYFRMYFITFWSCFWEFRYIDAHMFYGFHVNGGKDRSPTLKYLHLFGNGNTANFVRKRIHVCSWQVNNYLAI